MCDKKQSELIAVLKTLFFSRYAMKRKARAKPRATKVVDEVTLSVCLEYITNASASSQHRRYLTHNLPVFLSSLFCA